MPDELIDNIANDGSAAEISDAIKNALYGVASQKIEGIRSDVANTMFNYASYPTEAPTVPEVEEG
jgi:hypothetical protein